MPFFPACAEPVCQARSSILGLPRSGKTALHRLLAKDDEHFFCFDTWEIVFPSLLQKRVLSAIGTLDRRTGGRLRALVLRWEARVRASDLARVHRVGWFAPEEDEHLMFHILFAATLQMLFLHGGFEPIIRFDVAMDATERRRIMEFYLACVRRQACFRGGDRILLSQALAFSGRIQSLLTHCPGCRIVFLVRNPLDVVPSMISLSRIVIKTIGRREPAPDLDEIVYDVIKFLYTYPLSQLSSLPPERCLVVKYDDLLREPKEITTRIYNQFGIALTPEYETRLDEEVEKMKHYKSPHKHPLEECRISRERILCDLAPIFERFAKVGRCNRRR